MCLLVMTACTSSPPTGQPGPSSTPDQYTPLVPDVLTAPQWFTGTDGRAHLVYEVELTNAFAVAMDLTKVVVADGASGATLASFEGDDLLAIMTPLGAFSATSTSVPGSSVAMLWMDLPFDSPDQLPTSIRQIYTVGVPDGIPLPRSVEYSDPVAATVDRTPPVVLGPPLAGTGWVAVGSCCDGPHRRALQPVNGALRLGQRFAIDWNGVDADGFMVHGDQSQNAKWVFYGAPVLAVADATVVVAKDYLEDQVPNAPVPVGIEDADGNHIVLDLGNGRYAFYAHLEPHSVAVKAGDRVCKGQQIARLGNTGSSTGPHLHFHVSDSISALDANGKPYVFDLFEMQGKIPPLDEAIKLVDAGLPLPIDPVTPGLHAAQLPLGRDVVDFPPASSCTS